MAYLEVQDVSVTFGGLQALKEIHLEVEEHEIRGIIGPNGAGKSTLFNVISRIYSPDSGKILFRGMDLLRLEPHEVIRAGISRTFQNVELFYRMTVINNVLVGLHTQIENGFVSAGLRLRRSVGNEKRAKERALESLQFVGMDGFKDRLASDLSFGQRRLVELARTLVSQPTLLLLDEPAAGLSPQNLGALVNVIKRLRNEMKMTILLVEHVIKLVMGICDRITVLNDGEVIADGSAENIKEDSRVLEAYLGGEKKDATS
jgi:branched-chain amino acid transport system ATP-binding protein